MITCGIFQWYDIHESYQIHLGRIDNILTLVILHIDITSDLNFLFNYLLSSYYFN